MRPWLQRLERWWRAAVRFVRAEIALHSFTPLILPLALLPWFVVGVKHYREAPLFRDPSMYEYAAWCMKHGQKIYRDIATPDGPLIYLIHAFLQIFAKTSEQAFRKAHLYFHLAGAFSIGALLAPVRKEISSRVVSFIVWGSVTASMWLVYLLYTDMSTSVQREEYYALIGMGAVALAYRAITVERPIARAVMLVVAGVLSAAQIFGKHSGIIYVGLVLLVTLLSPVRRWRSLQWAAIGVLAGFAGMVFFIAAFGSLRGFLFWYMRYPFVVYRFWDRQPWTTVVGHARFGDLAVLTLVAGGAALWFRLLPRPALAFAVAPALHLLAGMSQLKGWHYQFSPVMASSYLFVVLGLAQIWSTTDAESWSPARVAGAIGVLLVVTWRLMDTFQGSDWMTNGKNLFERPNIKAVRTAAQILKDNTAPTDRVFYYGAEAIVPFLAERLPATPYEVPWMVDFTPALKESKPEEEDIPPTEAQRRAIVAMQDAVHGDLCARLRTHPPDAMAFLDGAEAGDAVRYVISICPEIQPMLDTQYRSIGRFDAFRLYVRLPAAAAAQP